MSYKKQTESKYNHCFYGNKLIIGLDKTLPENEACLLSEIPMMRYNYVIYEKIMQLKLAHRMAIVKSLERWNDTECKKSSFIGAYWEIVLDFIFAMFGKTAWDLTADIKYISYFKNYPKEDLRKIILDNIRTMKNNTVSVNEQGKEIYKRVCLYYRLTDDIVKTGYGTFFACQNLDRYTPEKVNEYCERHKNIVLEDMIADITGVKKADIKRIPIQIAFRQNKLEKNIYTYLNILIDELQICEK